MSAKKLLDYFKKTPWPGLLLALAGIQYFVCFAITAINSPSYSYLKDPISDLGTTRCLLVKTAYICSPQHELINSAFIALGLMTLIGCILLIWSRPGRIWRAGLGMLCVAAISVTLVGLFPINVAFASHSTAADIAFPTGAISLILLGFSRRLGAWMSRYCLVTAAVSIAAQIVLFYPGYGWRLTGLTERLAADPQALWIMVFGFYLLLSRFDLLSKLNFRRRTG